MRKKLSVISAFLIFSVSLSGCSKTDKYSEANYDVIASYIAHAVIKNDKNMAYKLIDMEIPVKEEEPLIPEPTSIPEESSDPVKEPDESEVPPEKPEVKLGTVLGADNSFDIDYVGYDVKDDLGSSDYFSLSPDAGKKFGVVTFKITNNSDVKKSISLLPDGIRYILKCDGEEIRSLSTVLDNDIHYFEGQIAAHKSKNVILIFQITDGTKSLEINITSGAGTYSHTIQ